MRTLHLILPRRTLSRRRLVNSMFRRREFCMAPSIGSSFSSQLLTLAEPVAEAVGGDHVEDLPGRAVVLLGVEVGEFLDETVRFELLEQRLQVLHVERAAVL